MPQSTPTDAHGRREALVEVMHAGHAAYGADRFDAACDRALQALDMLRSAPAPGIDLVHARRHVLVLLGRAAVRASHRPDEVRTAMQTLALLGTHDALSAAWSALIEVEHETATSDDEAAAKAREDRLRARLPTSWALADGAEWSLLIGEARDLLLLRGVERAMTGALTGRADRIDLSAIGRDARVASRAARAVVRPWRRDLEGLIRGRLPCVVSTPEGVGAWWVAGADPRELLRRLERLRRTRRISQSPLLFARCAYLRGLLRAHLSLSAQDDFWDALRNADAALWPLAARAYLLTDHRASRPVERRLVLGSTFGDLVEQRAALRGPGERRAIVRRARWLLETAFAELLSSGHPEVPSALVETIELSRCHIADHLVGHREDALGAPGSLRRVDDYQSALPGDTTLVYAARIENEVVTAFVSRYQIRWHRQPVDERFSEFGFALAPTPWSELRDYAHSIAEQMGLGHLTHPDGLPASTWRRLLIVRDEHLFDEVPFAALGVAGRPLGHLAAITYHPAGRDALRSLGVAGPWWHDERLGFLAEVDDDGIGLYERELGWSESHRREAEVLATHRVLTHRGVAADWPTFAALAPRARLIHVTGESASPGEDDPIDEPAAVRLAPHSRPLSADAVHRLDLSGCDLAVLNACRTGREYTQGEGWWGLTAAFRLAGVRTVVSARMSGVVGVHHRFSDAFYTKLCAGYGPAEAVRGAQMALFDDGEAPVGHWATYETFGAPGPGR